MRIRFVGGIYHNQFLEVEEPLLDLLCLIHSDVSEECEEFLQTTARGLEFVLDTKREIIVYCRKAAGEDIAQLLQHKHELLASGQTYRLMDLISSGGAPYHEYHLIPLDETRDLVEPGLALEKEYRHDEAASTA